MLKEQLHSICQFVAQKNTYFQTGFAEAWEDAETGCVFGYNDTGNKVAVFPNDNLGNYFYLRNEKKTGFALAQHYAVSDCFNAGMEMRSPVHLVAIVKNGDPEMLLQNLCNTLQFYKGAQIALNNAVWNAEDVIASEMSQAGDQDILAALQRAEDYAIVRVSFNVINKVPIQQLSCITPPYKTCS